MYYIVLLTLLLTGCTTPSDRAFDYDPEIPSDVYLERIQLELDAENTASQNDILNYTAVALIVLGSVSLAFGHLVGVSKVGSLSLIASGAICASLPRLFQSEYFIYLAFFVISVGCIVLSVFLWKRYQDRVDKDDLI